METITLDEARNLSLFAQGLFDPPSKSAARLDVKEAISRLGVLQIDTINIVARAPYFSMWSRLGDYDPEWINQLLADQHIFEGWAHEASFLPIEDFPLHRRLVLQRRYLRSRDNNWYEVNKADVDAILHHIKQNGPVRSSDFKRQDGARGTWWNWKFEKSALEYWFAAGELMISKRVNFQRVYDLRERIVPDWNDNDTPDLDTVYQRLIEKSIAAMGFALAGWVSDYFRLPKKESQPVFQKLIDEKRLIEIQVQDWKETCWALPEVWETYQTKKAHQTKPNYTTLLSPFDSLIWDRKRTRQLFHFDFSIECYLPAAKRKYGYFLLPILHNGELIGRIDVKAHRTEKVFEVKALYLEPWIIPDQALAKGLASALLSCAAWHQTPTLKIERCESKELLVLLQPMIPMKVIQ